MSEPNRKLAVFIDVDNAFPRFGNESLRRLFDRLAGIGTVHVCRAYADWTALADRTRETMRWAVTPVHLYTRGVQRKNAADIAVAVDAMEAMYLAPEVDTFVLVTGDTDLAPLATRLKERGKHVIGLGRRASSSGFLVRACHRFLYLEDSDPPKAPARPSRRRRESNGATRSKPAVDLEAVNEALRAAIDELAGQSDGSIHAGQLKSALLERVDGFREKDFGAKTFVAFLESQATAVRIRVRRTSSGSVRVTRATESGGDANGSDARPDGELPLGDPEEQLTLPDPEEARDLLERALNQNDSDDPANLAWLKETMLRMSPNFDERALGYKRFLDFVRDQDDLVDTVEVAPHKWAVQLASDT